MFFWAVEKPSLSLTDCSHLSRYGKKVFTSHYKNKKTHACIHSHTLYPKLHCTSNLKSLLERYGALKGSLCRFPADRLLTFIQSKNLLNMNTNVTVSATLSAGWVSSSALATELLRTYVQCINTHCYVYYS